MKNKPTQAFAQSLLKNTAFFFVVKACVKKGTLGSPKDLKISPVLNFDLCGPSISIIYENDVSFSGRPM